MQNLTNNENEAKQKTEVTYAGFLVRFIAFIIDIVIVGAASFIIKYIMLAGFSSVELFSKPLLFNYSIVDIFTYIIKVSYFIICVYCTQTTVGKYVMKLKVVNKDFEKLSLPAIIYRETVGRFLSSFLFVGYLLIFIQKDKAALHDILVDSRVIYACTVKKNVIVTPHTVMPPVNPYMYNNPQNNNQMYGNPQNNNQMYNNPQNNNQMYNNPQNNNQMYNSSRNDDTMQNIVQNTNVQNDDTMQDISRNINVQNDGTTQGIAQNDNMNNDDIMQNFNQNSDRLNKAPQSNDSMSNYRDDNNTTYGGQ